MQEVAEPNPDVAGVPASPPSPARLRAKRQQARGKVSGGEGGGDDRGVQLKVKRLEDELQSLREAYSRKIASTELRCEQLLRDKDDTASEWYKEKKYDIAKLTAGVTVMQALFEKKRRRIQGQMQEDKTEFERQKALFEADVERLRSEHTQALTKCADVLKEKCDHHEAKHARLNEVNSDLQRSAERLEDQLSQSRTQAKRSDEDCEKQRREIEELRRRLVESERTEELARRKVEIESLTEELKRTKRLMQEKANAEAEALRKELMEYVKFIVHILPDGWQAHVPTKGGSEDQMPMELRQRLEMRGNLGEAAQHDTMFSTSPRPQLRSQHAKTQPLPPVGSPGRRGRPASLEGLR